MGNRRESEGVWLVACGLGIEGNRREGDQRTEGPRDQGTEERRTTDDGGGIRQPSFGKLEGVKWSQGDRSLLRTHRFASFDFAPRGQAGQASIEPERGTPPK